MVTAPHSSPTHLFFSCLFCSLPDSDIVKLSVAIELVSSSFAAVAAHMVQVCSLKAFSTNSVSIFPSVNAGT